MEIVHKQVAGYLRKSEVARWGLHDEEVGGCHGPLKKWGLFEEVRRL